MICINSDASNQQNNGRESKHEIKGLERHMMKPHPNGTKAVKPKKNTKCRKAD